MEQLTFRIEGMTCAGCVARVERVLKKVPGVDDAAINLAAARATVAYDPQAADVEGLFEAVRGAGYTPVSETLDIPVEGMTCASCVARVERAIRRVPGVLAADVNLATEQARVTYASGAAGSSQIREAIRKAG